MLERALARLVDVVRQRFDFDYRNEPGAGSRCGRRTRIWFDEFLRREDRARVRCHGRSGGVKNQSKRCRS
ncbi:MAG: hypothetical protein QOE73_1111 [Verrucomicrobiota bacterium]